MGPKHWRRWAKSGPLRWGGTCGSVSTNTVSSSMTVPSVDFGGEGACLVLRGV